VLILKKFSLNFTAQRGPHYCSVCTSRNTRRDPSYRGEPANRRVRRAQMPLWELGDCAQIYSSGGLLCTPVNRATSGVHKGTQGIAGCAHRPANHAIGSVHKGAQGTAGCAHRQTIVRRLVCTNLLQRWAIVHTSQTYYEWCAQRCSGDSRLCTPLDNHAIGSVHKCARGIGGCAHQPNVLRSDVHNGAQGVGYCAHQ
jgi:hypothetical protein